MSNNQPAYTVNTPAYQPQTPNVGSNSWQDSAPTYQPPSNNQPAYTANTPAYQPQTPNVGSGWFVDTLSKYEGKPVSWQASAPQYQPPGSAASSDDSIWGDIWDWAKSDKGLDIISGTIGGLYDAYQKEKMYDRAASLSGGGGGGGPSAAELYDKRVKQHNKSINTPMDMGMHKLKR